MANTTHAKKGYSIRITDSNDADWVTVSWIYKVLEVADGCESDGSKCFRLLYTDGKEVDSSWWALPRHYEILSDSGDTDTELLKEAARRYTKGTHYLEVGTDRFGTKYHSIRPEPFVYDYSGWSSSSEPRIAVESGKGIVYNKGVWSPIVHETYQPFQEGDIVVMWRDIEGWEWEGIGHVETPPIGEYCTVSIFNKGAELNKLPSIQLTWRGGEELWYPATAFMFSHYYNQSQTNRGTAALNTTDHGKINQGRSIKVQRSTPAIITGERRTGSRVQGRGNAAIVRGGYSRHKACIGN